MSDRISDIIARFPEGEKRDTVIAAFAGEIEISAEQMARNLKFCGFDVSATTIKKYRRDVAVKP